MAEMQDFYRTRDYGTRIKPGREFKIERSISPEKERIDMSLLTALPVVELEVMREKSIEAEQGIFDKLCEAATEWDAQAAQTVLFDLALEYVKTPSTKHTTNCWEKGEHFGMTKSNMVYKMNYHIYEDTKYDREVQKSMPVAWYLTWQVFTNEPGQYRSAKIAGQDNKRFTEKAAMEKYLAGRIKAYDHLFAKLSPPIPPEYVSRFQVNGQLLPGYAVQYGEKEESSPNPSIKQMLAAYKKVTDGLSAASPEKTTQTHGGR